MARGRGALVRPLQRPPSCSSPSYRCVAHNGFGGLGGSGLSPSAFNCELPLPLPLEKCEVPRAIVSFSFLPDGPKKAIPQYFPCCSSSPLLFSKQDIPNRPTTINPFPFPDSSLTPALYEAAKCKENTRRNSFVKTRSVLAVDFFSSGLSLFVPRRVTRLRIYLRRSSKWGAEGSTE